MSISCGDGRRDHLGHLEIAPKRELSNCYQMWWGIYSLIYEVLNVANGWRLDFFGRGGGDVTLVDGDGKGLLI